MFENNSQIHLCSCIVKLQEKPVEKKAKNEYIEKQAPKLWLDYFNDIIKDELKYNKGAKSIIKNKFPFPKFLSKNKKSDLLIYNPFDIGIKTNTKLDNESMHPQTSTKHTHEVITMYGNNNSKKKQTLKQIRQYSSYVNVPTKNKIRFDDLTWENKMKKFINKQNLTNPKNESKKIVNDNRYVHFESNNEENVTKNTCFVKRYLLNLSKKRCNRDKNGCISTNMSMKKEGKKLKKNNVDNQTNLCVQKGENAEHCKLTQQNKKTTESQVMSNAATGTTNQNENTTENKLKNENINITEKVFKTTINEILYESENAQNIITQQKYDNILMIHDQKTGRAKLVTKKKIDVGEIIFVEECLLETTIELDDLWNKFNSLNDIQKEQLNYIYKYSKDIKNRKHSKCEKKCEMKNNKQNCDHSSSNEQDTK
ncbi:SET domain protein, putative, partial [Hepatocystis sp. ex Piliocolobus tephrosceles]